MDTTKKKIKNDTIQKLIKQKSIQSTTANVCSHCGVVYRSVKQHLPVCIMNPERKPRNGFVSCEKCNIAFPGKNISRHVASCNGSAMDSLDGVLQCFRTDYLRMLRGNVKPTKIDRSLGYGNRTVPEVVRANVENDLHGRGMPTEWTISPTLRVVQPDEFFLLNDDEVRDEAAIIADVVNLITDEESMARILNVIINNVTYKIAQDRR